MRINELEEKVGQYKRDLLVELLFKITDEQRAFFHGPCFPKGVSDEKLDGAIRLCMRTVKQNESSPSAKNGSDL